MRRFLQATLAGWRIASLLACLAGVGCAGYKLGPTGGAVAGARSVQIGQILNSTEEPRLSESVSHALRSRIQQDGTFKLCTHAGADVVVTVNLERYERQALSFQANDVVTIRDYDVNLVAHVLATETSTGKALVDREVRGRTTIRSNSDLGTAERENTSDLADSLAHAIVSLLAEGTW
ncbi:MAG TPA: hypothetical protein VMF06_21405 [Candidatus Limnocylindria bacterium]|nr:hypothetical protein [Candidatus Limnocylindria bacterium]